MLKFTISSSERCRRRFGGGSKAHWYITVNIDTARTGTDATLAVYAPTFGKAKTRCCELLDISDVSWREAHKRFVDAKQKKKADQQKRRLQVLKARRSHSLRQAAVAERQIKKLGAGK